MNGFRSESTMVSLCHNIASFPGLLTSSFDCLHLQYMQKGLGNLVRDPSYMYAVITDLNSQVMYETILAF